MADIVAKRFLMRERRTVFSRPDRIENFDSQNRRFGFYYRRISLAGPLLGEFCNNIDPERTRVIGRKQRSGLSRSRDRPHAHRGKPIVLLPRRDAVVSAPECPI